MSSNPFYKPIVVENFLDCLVFPAQRQEQPVEEYDQRLQETLRKLHRALYKLGASQDIHDPDIWRVSVLSILEEHFGVPATQVEIAGDVCDVIVREEGHVLIEIVSSAGRLVCERLLRKQKNYTEITGVAPARVILLTADIRSKWANLLEAEGVEIPLIDDDYSFEPCN